MIRTGILDLRSHPVSLPFSSESVLPRSGRNYHHSLKAAKLSQLSGEHLAPGSLWRPRVATLKPRGSSAITRKRLDHGVGRGDPVPAQADDPVLIHPSFTAGTSVKGNNGILPL